MDRPRLLDCVTLLRDLPGHSLRSGDLGTVVLVFDDAFEVEFADGEGATIALITLRPDEIRVVDRPAAK